MERVTVPGSNKGTGSGNDGDPYYRIGTVGFAGSMDDEREIFGNFKTGSFEGRGTPCALLN